MLAENIMLFLILMSPHVHEIECEMIENSSSWKMNECDVMLFRIENPGNHLNVIAATLHGCQIQKCRIIDFRSKYLLNLIQSVERSLQKSAHLICHDMSNGI